MNTNKRVFKDRSISNPQMSKFPSWRGKEVFLKMLELKIVDRAVFRSSKYL